MEGFQAVRALCVDVCAEGEEEARERVVGGLDCAVEDREARGGGELEVGAEADARGEVGARGDEEVRGRELLALGRPHQGRHAFHVALVRVGARGEQEPHDVCGALLAGFVQGRRAVHAACRAHLRARLQQRGHDFGEVVLGGEEEGGALLGFCARFQVGVARDEGRGDRGVAEAAGPVERRVAVSVGGVQGVVLEAGGEQAQGFVVVAEFGGFDEGGVGFGEAFEAEV